MGLKFPFRDSFAGVRRFAVPAAAVVDVIPRSRLSWLWRSVARRLERAVEKFRLLETARVAVLLRGRSDRSASCVRDRAAIPEGGSDVFVRVNVYATMIYDTIS